jgi:hypothetical protein
MLVLLLLLLLLLLLASESGGVASESGLVLELGEFRLESELESGGVVSVLGLALAPRALRSSFLSRCLLPKRPLEALERGLFPGSQAVRQRKAAHRVKPAL